MLSKIAVQEWREIYIKQTGKDISFEEATIRANRMFRWLSTITKPSNSQKIRQSEGGVITNGKKAKSDSTRRN